jgi:hypothetical protein
MEKAVNHARRPRCAYPQLAARQLFKLDPLPRLDAKVL